MSQLYLNNEKLKNNISEITRLRKKLAEMQIEVETISNNLSISSSSKESLKKQLKNLINQIDNQEKVSEVLSSTILNVIQRYQQTEKKIIENETNNIISKEVESERNAKTEEKEEVQQAIDFLNNLSMSTSVDGVVLSIVEYLVKLYDSAAEVSLLGKTGGLAGIIGVITGVAADIMNAFSNGESRNALLADIFVDIALFGVGVGAPIVGECVGTAVGGPVGTVVGKFAGGIVGNGASIMMNIDFDGDGETGKDAVSDWIDCQLDVFIGDEALA